MDLTPNPHNSHLQPLLQESFAEICFDTQNRIVVARWKGTLKLVEVVQGCELITDLVKSEGVQHHLSDHTALKKLPEDVQAYLTQRWFFEVERAGLKKIAVRLALDIFAQATVRRVNASEKHKNLQIEVFPSCERAYDWLLS